MRLTDRSAARPVRSREVVFEGRVWDVVREVVDLGRAGQVTRDFIDHPGAVAVIALDDDERVVLVHQYRHPAGVLEWEIPAGLRDVDGEEPVDTAARELAEEAFVSANDWYRLVEVVTTPGSSSETIVVFLARGLSHVPEGERHDRDGEELDMPIGWFPLDDVRQAVLDGRLQNATLTIAVLAACAARDTGWRSLDRVEPPSAREGT
jgi:8-oxo-dGTP pyrophosphatase MutT (NUDIX family)